MGSDHISTVHNANDFRKAVRIGIASAQATCGGKGVAGYVVRMVEVTKSFGAFQALKDISVTVEPGEFISLLGPSGCGKSTILRLLAELTPVSAGRIEWSDQVRRRENTGRPDLAFVFQEATLMPWRSVERNVAIP